MTKEERAAEKEREAVVRWLRKEARYLRDAQNNCDQWTPEWLSIREQVESAEEFADAIERGDHLRGEQ